MNLRRIGTALMWMAAVLAGPLPAAEFEYGGRPPGAVFDPHGVLETDATQRISEPLARIFRDEGVDVIVVILRDLEGAPPEHVARRFAAAWCESPIHAVVLHVPGDPAAPWVVLAGRLIDSVKPDLVRVKVAETMRNASREPKEADKVRSAANGAADMLRYWLRHAINRSEYLETERTRIRMELENQALRMRIVLLSAAAAAIPVMAGAVMVFWILRRPRFAMFPETRPPRRFGAPHAGGNHAVVELGPLPTGKP